MEENRPPEDEHQPRAEAPDFEPPRLTVIGTVQELTVGTETAGSVDGAFGASPL